MVIKLVWQNTDNKKALGNAIALHGLCMEDMLSVL